MLLFCDFLSEIKFLYLKKTNDNTLCWQKSAVFAARKTEQYKKTTNKGPAKPEAKKANIQPAVLQVVIPSSNKKCILEDKETERQNDDSKKRKDSV
ncbi:3942_t:CDS:2 [Gigaspora rosea]|nr:3942_t:CDS:2 [Gigaspora rosea]